MRKKLLYITFILLIAIFTGCMSDNIKSLNYKKLMNKIDNKESFILYIYNNKENTLSNTLNIVLNENNIKAYKFNTEKLSQDDMYKLKEKINYTEPEIVYINKGIDKSVTLHITEEFTSKEDLTSWLKNNDIIK